MRQGRDGHDASEVVVFSHSCSPPYWSNMLFFQQVNVWPSACETGIVGLVSEAH